MWATVDRNHFLDIALLTAELCALAKQRGVGGRTEQRRSLTPNGCTAEGGQDAGKAADASASHAAAEAALGNGVAVPV